MLELWAYGPYMSELQSLRSRKDIFNNNLLGKFLETVYKILHCIV